MIDPSLYHDAPILDLKMDGDTVYIDVDAFSISKSEEIPPTRLRISDVQSIVRDKYAVEEIRKDSDDGEIYRIMINPDHIEILIIWNNRNPRSENFVTYRFRGASLEVSGL